MDEMNWVVDDLNGPISEQPAFGPMTKAEAVAMVTHGGNAEVPRSYFAHVLTPDYYDWQRVHIPYLDAD